MLVLDNTTKTLSITLGGTNAHHVVVDYLLIPAGGRLADAVPGSQVTSVAVTSETTVLSAPSAGQIKQVIRLSVRNTTANSTTNFIGLAVSGDATYKIGATTTLASGQAVVYDRDGKPKVYNATGEEKAAA